MRDVGLVLDGARGVGCSKECREAAWARASRLRDGGLGFGAGCDDVDAEARQLQLQTFLQLHGLRRESTANHEKEVTYENKKIAYVFAGSLGERWPSLCYAADP
jgi:hypothetical protein